MLQAFVARPGVRHALWIVGLVMFLAAALALSLTGLGGPHPPTGPGWIAFFGVGLLVTFMGIPIDGGRQRMRFMLDTPFYLMAVAWAGLGPALLSAVLNTLVWSGQAPVVRLLRRHPRGLHWLRLWFAFVGTGAVVVSDEADRIVRRQPRIYRSHVARSLTMALSAGVVVALGRLAGWSVSESGAIGLAAVIVMLSAGSLAVNVASLGVLAGFIPSKQRAEFFGGDHWGRMLRSLPMELVMGLAGWGGVALFGWTGAGVLVATVWLLGSAVAQQYRTLEQQAALQAERTAARLDHLTGLPNRRALEEYVARLTAEAMPCVVAVVDADRFKRVNDTWGHDAGDAVLKAIAQRLKSACRTERGPWPDLVARWGGEEFVLVMPQLPRDAASVRMEHVRATVGAAPVTWESRAIVITCSMGATLCPDGIGDLDIAVKLADTGLYRAKESGRNRLAWHPDLLVPSDPRPRRSTSAQVS